jgi:hypothetical protein
LSGFRGFGGLPPISCATIVALFVHGLPMAQNLLRFRVEMDESGRLNSLEFGVHQGGDLVRVS